MILAPVSKPDKGIREIGLLRKLLIITAFHLTKTENRTKKSLTALILLHWVKVLFLLKMLTFYNENADISKCKGSYCYKI